jgi:hypothetical protein
MNIEKIEVEGWCLALVDGGQEPRILDVVLAERLGYERPADIRELIGRLIADGILNESEVIRTVRKTSPKGGRPGKEYWLTEEQAILVTTQSETATARTMLKTIVHVFRLASHGQLPGQQDAALQIRRMSELLTRMVESNTKQIEAMAARLDSLATTANETSRKVTVLDQRGNATLAPSEQKRLDELRRTVAQLVVDRNHKTPRAAWRIVQNEVEAASGFCGPLKDLPLHRYGDAIRALDMLRKRLEDMPDRNMSITFPEPPDPKRAA